MGSLIGHVAPGLGFFLVGLWHLFNHTKLFLLNGHKYRPLLWFPAGPGRLLRHLELYVIMFHMSTSVMMELFIEPKRHTPFDPDGTIPSNHLHNVEHALMFFVFFLYAASTLALDTLSPRRLRSTNEKIQLLVGAMAFTLELLLFKLHTTDHVGVEGQYHMLLQMVIVVCISTTLLGCAWPMSFAVGYARSLSILFHGVWMIVMGFMLYIPGLMSKGCFMNREEGHIVVRCHTDEWLHRAKSLVNIEFGSYLIGLIFFAVSFYLVMIWIYADDVVEYVELDQLDDEDDKDWIRKSVA